MLPVLCKKLQASELSSTLLKGMRDTAIIVAWPFSYSYLSTPTTYYQLDHPPRSRRQASFALLHACMSSCSPCSECIHYRDLANDGVRDGCALASGRSSSAKTYHTNCKHHKCCGVWFRASIAEASARRVLRIFGGGDDHCARWCGQWPGWLRSLQLAHATELCALWR